MTDIATRLAAILAEIEISSDGDNSRIGRGLRYALDRSTQDDGLQLLYDAQEIAGCYTLESFDAETVLEAARDRWIDCPELEALAEQAAARVAHKWSGTGGETAGAAVDWALDLIPDYADARGVTLMPLE